MTFKEIANMFKANVDPDEIRKHLEKHMNKSYETKYSILKSRQKPR